VVVLIVAFLGFVGIGLFERFVPRRVLRWYQKNVGSPLFRASAGVVPGWAVVETIGRKTGRPHRVPVGGRLIGDTYWFLAGTARDNQYVRNIERNPSVRVRIHGRWREGTAQTCPDEDARRRLLRLNPINGFFLWLTGFDLLTVRVDFDAADATSAWRR
jgi:deazaflavin-dependent oxidoreductase (nitroreductase family)